MYIQQFRTAFLAILVWTVITGVLYPAVMTGAAQALFPYEANGSLVRDGDLVRGSRLIGQQFDDPKFFRGRHSATGPVPYNAAASSGSNLGPLNPALRDAVKAHVEALRAAAPENDRPIPVDLVTASGSGLDPHISPAAAHYQLDRVAVARNWDDARRARARALIEKMTAPRRLGVLGEETVNVLELNLAVERI